MLDYGLVSIGCISAIRLCLLHGNEKDTDLSRMASTVYERQNCGASKAAAFIPPLRRSSPVVKEIKRLLEAKSKHHSRGVSDLTCCAW